MKSLLFLIATVLALASVAPLRAGHREQALAALALAGAAKPVVVASTACRCGDACPNGCENCGCAAKAKAEPLPRTIAVAGVCVDGSCGVPNAAPTIEYSAVQRALMNQYTSQFGACSSGSCGAMSYGTAGVSAGSCQSGSCGNGSAMTTRRACSASAAVDSHLIARENSR